MKFPPRYFGSVVVAASAVLLSPSAQCSEESGAFDPGAALHFKPPVLVGRYAFDADRVFGTQTQMIRRKATERQRQVAIANARAYEAAQIRALGGANLTPKSRKADDSTAKPKSKIEPQSMREIREKLPHIVAVNTEMDARSAPGTKREVMLWDTHAESLVDNYVYDEKESVPVGTFKKYDTYSTVYVGGKVSLPEIAAGPPKK